MTNDIPFRTTLLLGCALVALNLSAPSARAQDAVTATLYADGAVDCFGVDDVRQPSGTVTLLTVPGGVEFDVALTGAAPNWDYSVRLSQEDTCQFPQVFQGLSTDADGSGTLHGLYTAAGSMKRFLVTVQSDPHSAIPPDPKDRELGTLSLVVLTQPVGVGARLKLGFDGAPDGLLPWSEQGFTFTGGPGWGFDVGLAGEQLSLVDFFWFPTAYLTRDADAPFDAVSLDVTVAVLNTSGGYGYVASDRGGFVKLTAPGTVALDGPLWSGVRSLEFGVISDHICWSCLFDGWIQLDDFVVRTLLGETYCVSTPNSTGTAAAIDARGSPSLTENDLMLRADGVPNAPFLFFHGADTVQLPFGDGVLCVSGDVVRLPGGLATGNVATTVVDLPAAGITAPGERHFQCWFRDPGAGGVGSNTSNALTIAFVP